MTANLPTTTENEFTMAPAVSSTGHGLTTIEQSRAVAEVQASLVLARANPRDEQRAYNAIMNSCKRKSLAERASYAYKRGGTLVTGPSIRLAELIAAQWGNINYGFREVGRGKDYSEVEAFAHDLQTNTRVVRQFQVKHWRDKKGGGSALTEERDKYEMVASQAQRRVRSCLLELIPGDVVEAAEEACRATLEKSIGNIEEQVEKILVAFKEYGVTAQDIEAFLQRSIKSIVPADVVNLKRVYRSIRDGIAAKEEFFKPSESDLNARFSGDEKTVVDNDIAKKKGSTEPLQKQGEEAKQDAGKNGGAPSAEKNQAKTDTLIRKFLEEIDSLKTAVQVDQWRAKHHKRVERELPGENDFMTVMAYANDRHEYLKGEEAKA